MLASVGPKLAYVGPMLSHLGGYVGHMLRTCWLSGAYVGDMLGTSVAKIFRRNFVTIFSFPRSKKPEKKTTFFHTAQIKLSAAEGPKTL